jgi:SAM-dependent methyltransferase
MVDWGTGQYERTASELEPVAEHVASLAGLERGERVLDVACGTGNAALAAARRGATVTGLDASARLLEVARDRAAAEEADASFLLGDMQALPFEDGTFDLALSIFGVIFAEDASAALAEMLRVLRPDGRALITAWVPVGAIHAMVGAFGEAMAAVSGPTPARFDWQDPRAVTELASAHGAAARFQDGGLTITAASPDAYLTSKEHHNPLSLAGRPVLERAGTYAIARGRALQALQEGNEDPDGFRVQTSYRVIEMRRRPVPS